MKRTQDNIANHIRVTQRKIRGAVMRGPLVLLTLVALATLCVVLCVHSRIEVSTLELLEPQPTGNTVGVQYVVTNTGNLPDAVWITYEPVTNVVKTTLSLSGSALESRTVALPEARYEPLSILPDGEKLNPGQTVTLDAVVEHNETLPVEFVIHFATKSGRGGSTRRRIQFWLFPE